MAGPLSHNPPNADRHITDGAIAWLWVVFGFMIVSALVMIFWTFTRPRGTRFFHNIATIILATSTIAYFSMASDLGSTPISVEFEHAGISQTRQIWYVRYIQYFINFPLLLIVMLFATGMALSDILTTAFFSWIVVVCGLVGALTASTYKWGYFTLGLSAFTYIWTVLLAHAPRTSFYAGDGVRRGYVRGSVFVALVTLLYPLAWGLSEGGNVLSPSGEMVFYGILDLILGPLFLYYFVYGLRSVDYAAFGFRSGKFTDSYPGGTSGLAGGAATAAATEKTTPGPGVRAAGPVAGP